MPVTTTAGKARQPAVPQPQTPNRTCLTRVRVHLQRGGLLQPSTPLPGLPDAGQLVLTRFDADLHRDVLAVAAGEVGVLRGDP